MLNVSLHIEAIDAIARWIDSLPAPLSWHMIDARETLREALDAEYARRADDYFETNKEPAQ